MMNLYVPDVSETWEIYRKKALILEITTRLKYLCILKDTLQDIHFCIISTFCFTQSLIPY